MGAGDDDSLIAAMGERLDGDALDARFEMLNRAPRTATASRSGTPRRSGRAADARRRRADLRATAAADEWAYVTQRRRAAFRPGSPPRRLPSAMPTRRRMDRTEETVRRERRPLVADLAVGTVGLCIHRFVPCQTLQRDASVEWLQLQTDLLGLCAPPVCTDAAQAAGRDRRMGARGDG